MALRIDDWNSLWRASAYEAVPYTEDFPECLLVLPELTDGAVAQGAATQINIRFDLNESGINTLSVSDNGTGITNESRLLRWASPKNAEGDAAIHHRYGHGSKKCLTKFCPAYEKAAWMIQYRKKDRRGIPGSLHVITGPFRGRDDTPQIEDERDETTLMPSGTQWKVEFDAGILGIYQNPEKLYESVKEILRTRYSAKFFERTAFILEVYKNGTELYTGNSKTEVWKTFQEILDTAVREGVAQLKYDVVQPFNAGTVTFRYYHMVPDGRQSNPLKDAFPILGQKNMRCSRIHIGLNGRFVEARHIYKFHNREANHNDYNGLYGVVNFEGDLEQLPTPSTTKVSFYDNCPNYVQFKNLMSELLKKPFISTTNIMVAPSSAPLPAPLPAPVPAPLPASLPPILSITTEPNAIIVPPTNVIQPSAPLPITFKVIKKMIHVVRGITILYKIKFSGECDDYIDVLGDMLRTFGTEKFMKCCEALL